MANQFDIKISDIIITAGIPANVQGYRFIRDAIKIVIENPKTINRITKDIYPLVAAHFGTSSSKVERAIRHAIEIGWSSGKLQNVNDIFGIKRADRLKRCDFIPKNPRVPGGSEIGASYQM